MQGNKPELPAFTGTRVNRRLHALALLMLQLELEPFPRIKNSSFLVDIVVRSSCKSVMSSVDILCDLQRICDSSSAPVNKFSQLLVIKVLVVEDFAGRLIL